MARKFSLVRAGVYLLALVGGVSLPAAASIPAPSYITQWGESGSGPGQLLYPRGIAVGPNGNVYVTDHGNNRVQVFTSNGDFVTQWGSYGSGNGQFFSPWGIAVDGDGNVYVADYANYRIQKFTGDGGFITKWACGLGKPGSAVPPLGIAVDHSGNVYVTGTNAGVYKYTRYGAFIRQWVMSRGAGADFACYGVAVGAGGTVYATDTPVHQVDAFTSDGAPLFEWGSFGSAPGQLTLARGLAIDRNGDVYEVDNGNHRMQKFSASGAFISSWGGPASTPGDAWSPSGAAVDADGNLYIVDDSNNRIQKFGMLPEPTPFIRSVSDLPNDQGGELRVTWEASSRESSGVGVDAYLVRQRDSEGWVTVCSVLPNGSQTYSCIVQSTSDSTGYAPLPWKVFRIEAEARDSVYVSAPDSGYSVDNLPPAEPSGFMGTFAAGLASLHWQKAPESDAAYYALYRGPTLTFAPSSANLLATTNDTAYVDSAGAAYFYKLFTADIHGNASPFALWAEAQLLPPAQPTGFVGTFSGGIASMHWHRATESDFAYYSLHRDPTSTFAASAANLVATTSDTAYVDNAGAAYCYKLLTLDIYGNASTYALYIPDALLAAPGNTTAIQFDGVSPNPSLGGTLRVHFRLSSSETASIALLDTAGRLVLTKDVGRLGAGTHTFDLVDSRRLPAGLYFLRLRQGSSTRITRVAVLK